MDKRDKQEWVARHAKAHRRKVAGRIGPATDLVTADVRDALLCREIVYQLLGQDESVHDQPVSTWIALARATLREE